MYAVMLKEGILWSLSIKFEKSGLFRLLILSSRTLLTFTISVFDGWINLYYGLLEKSSL